MNRLEKLEKEKLELRENIEKINDEIRLEKLNKLIKILKDLRKNDITAYHEIMPVVAEQIKECMYGAEVKIIHHNFTEIITNNGPIDHCNHFICISDTEVNDLYDIIKFLECEAHYRKENQKHLLWINDHRLDKYLADIEFELGIEWDLC